MVTQTRHPVNVLPDLPPGLDYKERTYNQQFYVTTGGFSADATDQTRQSLRALGALILDCDLIDYVTHDQDWPGSVEDRKARMYREFADPDALAALKARHIDDVMATLDEVCDSWAGSSDPTYVVDSGWGLHLYFWLDDIVTGANIDRARLLNKELVTRFNAAAGYELADKGVHDAGTRIMRQVGSMNIQARLKGGVDVELPCQVIEALSHPQFRWELDSALGSVADHCVGPKGQAPPPSVSTKGSSDARSGDPTRLAGMLGWLLKKSKAVSEAFDEAKKAQDSEPDMSLACTLARVNAPPVIISTVLEMVREHPNKHDGTDYYNRTALMAWTSVRKDEDVDPVQNFRVMHQDALAQLRTGMSSVNQSATIAQYDDRIHRMLWVDERTRRIQWATDGDGLDLMHRFFAYHEIPVPPVRRGRREFTDQHAMKLCQWMENVYGVLCMAAWRDVMVVISSGLTLRNPVVEHLEKCNAAVSETDPELLETWLLRAFPGLPDTRMTRIYSKKWLIGGVARAIDPGIFIKGMLVLISDQSNGKTSMFRLLGGEFYDSPSTSHLDSKDATMACHYSWLLELEEMDFLRKTTIEAIKKYLTTDSDKIRLPYGSQMETFHRPCFYAGTANKPDILADTTGNDRFWCIELPNHAVCDFDWVEENRSAIWAAAYRAWMAVRDGTTQERMDAINMTIEERAGLREANREFERGDAIEGSVLTAAWTAAIHGTRPGNEIAPLRFTWEELFRALHPTQPDERAVNVIDKMDRAMQGRVGDLLQKNGFRYAQRRLEHDQSRTRMWFAPESWNERYADLMAEQAEAKAAGNLFIMPSKLTESGAAVDKKFGALLALEQGVR